MNADRSVADTVTSSVAVAATPADLEAIGRLLRSVGLSAEGIADHLGWFQIIREQGRVLAVAGLEDHGTTGLLRSVAVAPDRRDQGLAARLVAVLIDRSRALGHSALYLRTDTAERYFERFGFQRVDPADVAPAVLRSAQFQGECCASSATMVLELDQDRLRQED